MTPAQVEEAAALYPTHSLKELGARYGVCWTTVRRYMKAHGVEMRPPGYKLRQVRLPGPLHPKWGGGRVNKRGYWHLREIDHPHANGGYVPEHRVVIEQHLRQTDPEHPGLGPDGCLRRDWCVHHRNGDKGDNRLENLEPMPRHAHTSDLHLHQEIARLRGLLDAHGVDWTAL
jgi:hypothetical protein